MPGSYVIDSERRTVFIRAWGVLTDAEMRAHVEALRSDSRFDSTYGRISDFREVTTFALSAVVIGEVARALSSDSPVRRATIVAGDLAYGLARMSQLTVDAPPELSNLFRDLAPAMVWVGLPVTAEWPAGSPHFVVDDSPGPGTPSAS